MCKGLSVLGFVILLHTLVFLQIGFGNEFLRTSGTLGVEAGVSVDANGNLEGNHEVSLPSDIFGHAATFVSVSSEESFASDINMSNALSLTPIGISTPAPTIDTTFSFSQSATGTSASAGFGNPTGASSGGTSFTITGTDQLSIVYGGLYLLRNGQGTAASTAGGETDINLLANVGPFKLIANGASAFSEGFPEEGEWRINVNNDPFTTLSSVGLSLYLPIAFVVELNDQVDMDASSLGEVDTTSGPNPDGSAQQVVGASATAWATIVPMEDFDGDGDVDGNDFLMAPAAPVSFPLAGNFDSDLDIDGADFLAWQRGFGTGPNAVVADGDADGNGFVDSEDLVFWTLRYGANLDSATIPPLSAVTAVPEPNALALVSLACALVMKCRRK